MLNRWWLVGLLSAALMSLACDDRGGKTRRVVEPFTVVPGTPQVDTATPQVLQDSTRETGSFEINVPRQCDVFQQVTVRKVDILWVVDSSGSMAPKQARLAANFSGFIQELVSQKPPIDFHIAVVSTDTDDPGSRGALRPWRLGDKSASFIACTPQTGGASSCNTAPGQGTAAAIDAFKQMATVGTAGSAQERGLHAAYLALENPENLTENGVERFVRPDAALYVVVVSDEDDSSCHPLGTQPVCTADPGCRCAPDTLLAGASAYGSTGYFSRYLETYKGYGNGHLVALAAIVALDGTAEVPSQFNDPLKHVGCTRPAGTGGTAEVAYYGGRYVQVANETGGVAVSICDNDFSGALASLGYAASGLRKEFRLSRAPVLRREGDRAAGLQLFVSPPNAGSCAVDGNCAAGQVCRSGRCAQAREVSTTAVAQGAQYRRCDGTSFVNSIRFSGLSVPESLSAVEICYDVETPFQSSCP
jgi:hypothetical protein